MHLLLNKFNLTHFYTILILVKAGLITGPILQKYLYEVLCPYSLINYTIIFNATFFIVFIDILSIGLLFEIKCLLLAIIVFSILYLLK